MKIQKILATAAALLLVVLVIQVGYRYLYRADQGPQMIAEWKERPTSLDDAESLADEVIIGRVIKIEHADDLVARAPRREGDVHIPVEVITIEVESKIKGKSNGQREIIRLFHTGHSDARSMLTQKAPDKKVAKPEADDLDYKGTKLVPLSKRPKAPTGQGSLLLSLHEDPLYKIGEKYVLFVKRGPDLKIKGKTVATEALISPEGRYRISNNKLTPMVNRGFTARLRGKGITQLQTDISNIQKLRKAR